MLLARSSKIRCIHTNPSKSTIISSSLAPIRFNTRKRRSLDLCGEGWARPAFASESHELGREVAASHHIVHPAIAEEGQPEGYTVEEAIEHLGFGR